MNDILLPWPGLPTQPNRAVDVQSIEEAIANSPRLAGRRLVLILDELARWFSNLKGQTGVGRSCDPQRESVVGTVVRRRHFSLIDWNKTKKAGTKNTARIVDAIMPPNTAVPSER